MMSGWRGIAAAAIGTVGGVAFVLHAPQRFLLIEAGACLAVLSGVILMWPDLFTVVFLFGSGMIRNPSALYAGLEVQSWMKLGFGLLILAYIVKNGARAIHVWPIYALLLVFAVSILAANWLPTLTTFQAIKSLGGLVLIWVPFYVKWSEKQSHLFIRCLALIASVSVAAGALFMIFGGESIFDIEESGALRLQGATIAAGMGSLGFVGFCAALFHFIDYSAASRRDAWVDLLLAGVNFACVVLSGTRMPIVSSVLVIVLSLLNFRPPSLQRGNRMYLAASLLFIALILVAYLPELQLRQTADSGDLNSSGRDWIWTHFYSLFEQGPWFGRGIGASSIGADYDTGVLDELEFFELLPGQRVPHNEYLRLLVDGGIVGLVLFILSIVLFWRNLRYFSNRAIRARCGIFLIAFALYSFTDNTLYGMMLFGCFYLSLLLHGDQRREGGDAKQRPFSKFSLRNAQRR